MKTLYFNLILVTAMFCGMIVSLAWGQSNGAVDTKQQEERKSYLKWATLNADEYEKAVKANKQSFKEDLPFFIETGDVQKDNERYMRLKTYWIANNKELYEKMTAGKSKHYISRKEFETMPEEKKAHILANPDKYAFKD